jgi:hypothetical protein
VCCAPLRSRNVSGRSCHGFNEQIFGADEQAPRRQCHRIYFLRTSYGGKWLATLKEIAPATVRAALMVNPDITFLQGRFYDPAFESAAAALSVEAVTAHVRSTGDIEAALDSLGQRPGGGLIVGARIFHLDASRPGIVPAARRRGDRIDRATAHVALLRCMSPEVGHVSEVAELIMSAPVGHPDGMCSLRAVPVLDHLRHARLKIAAAQIDI